MDKKTFLITAIQTEMRLYKESCEDTSAHEQCIAFLTNNTPITLKCFLTNKLIDIDDMAKEYGYTEPKLSPFDILLLEQKERERLIQYKIDYERKSEIKLMLTSIGIVLGMLGLVLGIVFLIHFISN